MDDYVHVNIHDTGIIPVLRRKGPIYGMGMGIQLYRRLKSFGVQIYTIEEDKKRLAAEKAQEKEILLKEAADELKITDTVVLAEPEKKLLVKEVEKDSLDELLEKKLEDLPEDELENIVLDEEDLKEIEEFKAIKKYTEAELKLMTKAQIKKILNIERGFEPGHKYYGGYKDTLPALISFVLNSQK